MKPKAVLSKLNGPAKSSDQNAAERKKKSTRSVDVNDDVHGADKVENTSEKRGGK